jgi:hypothetical protein
MNADERLNKRIEIADRFIANLASNASVATEIKLDMPTYTRFALDVADSIIDTAIGDMTAEPK